VLGDTHAQADVNVLHTVGFSETRRVDGEDLVAEAYLLKTDPKARQLWENAQADPNYRAMVGCSIRGSLDVAKDQVRAGSDEQGEYVEFDGGWRWKNIMLLPSDVAAWTDTSVAWGGMEQAVAAAEAALREDVESEITQAEQDLAASILQGEGEAAPSEAVDLRAYVLQDAGSGVKVSPATSGYASEVKFKASGGVGVVVAAPKDAPFQKGSTVVWTQEGTPVKITQGKKVYTLVRPYSVLLGWSDTQASPLAAQAAVETEAPVAGATPQGEEPLMDEKEKAGLFQRALAAVASVFSGDVAAAEVVVGEAAIGSTVAAMSDEDRQAIVDGLYEKLRADIKPEEPEAEVEAEPTVEAEAEAEVETEAAVEAAPSELEARVASLVEQVAALDATIESLKGTVPVVGQHPVKPVVPGGAPEDKGTPLSQVTRSIFGR
jgi:hypothetical protein